MTGIEMMREWANELREAARAYRDGEIGYVPIDMEACQRKNAARLDAIADQIERETLPRPRFADGEPVQWGDECAFAGGVDVVHSITLYEDGKWHVLGRGVYGVTSMDGPLRRPEPPDTWERIEADSKKFVCDYYGRKLMFDCREGKSDACPVSGTDDECDMRMAQDLVRRCKKLAGVE